jgi:hypothetical protein
MCLGFDHGKSQNDKILYRFVDRPKHDAGPETCITYGGKKKLSPVTKSGNDESDTTDNLLDILDICQTYFRLPSIGTHIRHMSQLH